MIGHHCICLIYRDGSVIASYNASYSMESLFDNVSLIIEDIRLNILPVLSTRTINSSDIDDLYLNDEVQDELDQGNDDVQYCAADPVCGLGRGPVGGIHGRRRIVNRCNIC